MFFVEICVNNSLFFFQFLPLLFSSLDSWEMVICFLNYFTSFRVSTPMLADGFSHEFEWQQVSRILLSILVNLNYAVVCILVNILVNLNYAGGRAPHPNVPVNLNYAGGRAPHVIQLPSPPVPIPIVRWLYQEHQIQLVSPTFSCFTAFIIPWFCPDILFFFAFFQFYFVVSRDNKVHNFASSLFSWL